MTVFTPPGDSLYMAETDHQQRALHRNLQTQVTSAAGAPLPSALRPRGASVCGWLSGSPQSRWGAGKASQPTSQPLFCSLGRRCRGQACSEPAGRLPQASPARQAELSCCHSLWLRTPQHGFWWKQTQLAQTNSPSTLFLTCCCQNSVRRNKGKHKPRLLLGKLFKLKETGGNEQLNCTNLFTHFCCQTAGKFPPGKTGKFFKTSVNSFLKSQLPPLGILKKWWWGWCCQEHWVWQHLLL